MKTSLAALFLVASAIAGAQTDIRAVLLGDARKRVKLLSGAPKRYTPKVLIALKDRDPKIRRLAAIALREMDAPKGSFRDWRSDLEEAIAPSVAGLAAAARDPQASVRREAIVSLVTILRVRLWGNHGDAVVERESFRPLIALGEEAVPTLISMLQQPKINHSIGMAALAALNGIDSPKALPILLEGTSKFDGAMKGEAMEALADYDDPRVVPAIIANLGRGHYFLGEPGVKVLGRMKRRALPEMILALAKNPNPKLRAHLADAMGMFRDARAVGPLLAALNDGDTEVRASAAYALHRYPQPAVVTALIRSAQDPEIYVRTSAIASLGRLRDPAAFDTLAKALTDPSPAVRSAATSIVLIDGYLAVPLLLPLFKDQEVKYRVAEAVAPLRDWRTAPGLLEVLRTSDEYQGAEAGIALAEMGVTEAIPILIRQLADDYRGDTASRALFILGPKAADALLEFYPKSGKAKPNAITALGGTRDVRAVNLLLPLLPTAAEKGKSPEEDFFDPKRHIAFSAIGALGHLGDRRALRPLLRLLGDQNWDWIAAEALGDLKAVEAVEPLLGLLKRKRIRDDAACALAKIGDSRAIESLLAYLEDPEPYDWETIEALGNLRDPRILTFLVSTLKKERQGAPAAMALGKMGDPAAISARHLVVAARLDKEKSRRGGSLQSAFTIPGRARRGRGRCCGFG
ncbi:hypothetical protein EON81_10060 [bacterium]|nr:MAG: hypothetical protein EON81_10060 [bacterium]